MDIFKQYPDLYEEMIEEKKDGELLKLFKSMQPQLPGVIFPSKHVAIMTRFKIFL